MEAWREELYHSGVKGMKWGKHKYVRESNGQYYYDTRSIPQNGRKVTVTGTAKPGSLYRRESSGTGLVSGVASAKNGIKTYSKLADRLGFDERDAYKKAEASAKAAYSGAQSNLLNLNKKETAYHNTVYSYQSDDSTKIDAKADYWDTVQVTADSVLNAREKGDAYAKAKAEYMKTPLGKLENSVLGKAVSFVANLFKKKK